MLPFILLLVVIGAAAGFLATKIMRVEAGIGTTITLGIAGALIGGLALRLLFMLGGLVIGFVFSVLGAMALIWVWQRYRKR